MTMSLPPLLASAAVYNSNNFCKSAQPYGEFVEVSLCAIRKIVNWEWTARFRAATFWMESH
jgi:hypothetical protein